MTIIDNKLHLSDADYENLALRIESDAEECTEEELRCTYEIEGEDTLFEMSIRAMVFFTSYRHETYSSPAEGGELERVQIYSLYPAGWSDGSEIELEFDPAKLRGEFTRVSNRAMI